MEPLVFLDGIGDGDAPLVGGKAATLARLKRRGFPVPDGFVLLPEAPLDETLLGPALARLGSPVAVRSSSTAEDLAEASFAGQYRTVLDVSGVAAVVEAVRSCRASAAGAEAYAREMGTGAGRMAVLVQRMVEAEAAGAAFGRDPRNPRLLLVEATRGRGDRLLAGTASPDRYALDRETRALAQGPADGVLNMAALGALQGLLARVEEALGGPQDVEWAMADLTKPAEIALLQARPITAAAETPADPRLHRLTRANVGEVLPGPVTPLTFTTIGAFLEHAFRSVLGDAGLLPADAPPVVVLHRQRLYLNLSLALELAPRLPGLTTEDAERLLLGSGSAAGAAAPRPSFALLGVALRLLRLGARRPGAILEAERLVAALRGEGAPEGLSPEVLATRLMGWATAGRRTATTHVLTSGASATALAFLTRLLAAVLPGDAAGRVSRLTAGLEGVASAAPALALEDLARRAASHPEWRAFLRSGAFPAGDPLSRAPEDLRRELAAFLSRFGHRALSEGELQSSSWADDPTPVLQALAPLIEAGEAVALARRSRAELRRVEEDALFHRLGVLGPLFERVLRRAQDGVREREHTKSLTVAVAHHGRRLVRAAGSLLSASGGMSTAGDVFFLELGELLNALRGERPDPRSVARRRRRFLREGALEVPREVDLRAASSPCESSPSESDGVFRGIGVSSGAGRGPVRILRPGGTPRLDPGDVLVAPVLDAALGPLLAAAAGAVAEMGGVLSHGSVVARELGVPCVVDVAGITEALHDGEIVLVDGGSGEVRREAAAASAGEGRSTAPPSFLDPEDDESERFAALLAPPPARESVYFTFTDSGSELRLIATLGARAGGRGESVLALSLSASEVLFGLDLARAAAAPRSLRVAGLEATLGPTRLRGRTRLFRHEAGGFPPPPLPLLLHPRTVEVELDLVFQPTSPTFDFCRALGDAEREAVRALGDHHLEQAGDLSGTIRIDGHTRRVAGTATRDHSWGQREWSVLDHERLFLARFGEEVALHALTLCANGRIIEGGFLHRQGRAERITRILHATERRDNGLVGVEVEVRTAAGAAFRMAGSVERTLSIPVQVERRPHRHLRGRPYSLLLHENFVRWTAEGRSGFGVAELSERPR